MGKRKTKIIGYCRESTQTQYEEGYNIYDQEKKIRQYINVYMEEGTYDLQIEKEAASAKSLNRPRMNEILNMASRRQFDVFVVHNLDRMTRRVKDLAELLDVFDRNGIQLVSISEKIDTKTPMGRFFIYLIVLIAQWEQETIRDRTCRGMLESARQGNYSIPKPPYGYRRDPEDNKHLVIYEPEAMIVREMFSQAIKKGSVKRVRSAMFEENTDLYREMSTQRLMRMLSNTAYYGTVKIQGVTFDDFIPKIISKEEFDIARSKLAGVTPRIVKTKHGYLYKKYIYCENCNVYLRVSSTASSNGTVHKYYICEQCNLRISEVELSKTVFPCIEKKVLEEECNAISIENMTFKEQYHLIRKKILRINFKKRSRGKIAITWKENV